jgi:uncharacterized FlaG/YvyC family protein
MRPIGENLDLQEEVNTMGSTLPFGLVAEAVTDDEVTTRRAQHADARKDRRRDFEKTMAADDEAREARRQRNEATKAGRNTRARQALRLTIKGLEQRLRDDVLDVEFQMLTEQAAIVARIIEHMTPME